MIVLYVYLTSIIGVGRYSCHCDHASEISILGISSKCSCVEETHKKDPNHHCVCGAHLISKEPKRDDCCSLKYFFLDTDQDSSTDSYTVSMIDSPIIQPIKVQRVFATSIVTLKIKTFKTLFHRVMDSLFEKKQQLLL